MNVQQMWKCNGNDQRAMPESIWQKDLSILSESEEMLETLFAWQKIENTKEIVLPLVQNIEGAVLGADVIKREKIWTTGNYPFSRLEEADAQQFSLMKDSRIQSILEVIEKLKTKLVVLEVEAPFSVLASLVNPMELYDAMQTRPELLDHILTKITREETKYLEAATDAGCTIISLAEPTGTIDMVGEKYFKECSGKAVLLLLKESQKFLKNSIVHLCGKLSNSMLVTNMAKENIYPVNSQEYLENLTEAARNPEIHFAGQHCIHQKKNTTGQIHILTLL